MRSFIITPILSFAAALLLGACARPVRTIECPIMHSAPVPRGLLFLSADIAGVSRHYALYIPREYDAGKPWPLVVFLNGSGECGTDGIRQAAVGLGPAILANPERWPCVVLFPQKPDQPSQWDAHDALVMALIESTRRELNIDPDRIMLTGLSQGGAGTWAIGANHPELFAALAPVCGYGDPDKVAARSATLPIWAFHGLRDDVVRPELTQRIVDAVKAAQAGGSRSPEPKLTLLPEANHNAWDPAYRNEELPRWLLAQRRPNH